MTDDEINELRALLSAEAEESFSFERLYDADADHVYGDVDGYTITPHEMKVFDLDPLVVPRVAAAFMFYEDMCEMTEPPMTEGRTHELIMKAKAIAPPETVYGEGTDSEVKPFYIDRFMWFAKTFADVPMKQAYSFYLKNEVANLHLVQFSDGS